MSNPVGKHAAPVSADAPGGAESVVEDRPAPVGSSESGIPPMAPPMPPSLGTPGSTLPLARPGGSLPPAPPPAAAPLPPADLTSTDAAPRSAGVPGLAPAAAPTQRAADLTPPPAPSAHPAAPVAPRPAASAGVEAVGAAEGGAVRLQLDDLLTYLDKVGGSDLHLSTGAPPAVRVRGEMAKIPNMPRLTSDMIRTTLTGVMSKKQQAKFEVDKELNFAYNVPNQGRFRVNVMMQQGSMGAVLRAIPWEIKSLDALGMPEVLGTFADLPRGLVLVTGATGSGKSTTCAAIIDKANRTRAGHILTIEDPIEFVHQHRLSIVNQREVGEDTDSFGEALRNALRQDPDIILVGEMRDQETIATALTAAETGHLVFGTLHTQSAQETVSRIVDVFPANQQAQIRTQLAGTIQGIVCQTLCKTKDGNGRVAATEILIATPGIRNQIREEKLEQMQSALQTGAASGMHTLNKSLADLVAAGRISLATAVSKSSSQKDLINLLGGEEAARRLDNTASTAPTGVL